MKKPTAKQMRQGPALWLCDGSMVISYPNGRVETLYNVRDLWFWAGSISECKYNFFIKKCKFIGWL